MFQTNNPKSKVFTKKNLSESDLNEIKIEVMQNPIPTK
jgi:hypothetical protein